jgi:HK97 family phage major capsid protein
VALAEIIPGGMPYKFLGFPVEIVQVLPAAFAVSSIVGFFGNLSLAVMMGDRRTLTLATSMHLHFAEDMLTLRGTERIDINVHDIGNNSATPANRVAGPLVALMTAAT